MGKVLLLGAGASYGHGAPASNKPPLAAGFFSTLKGFPDLWKMYKPLVDFIKLKISADIEDSKNVDIENITSVLEEIWDIQAYEPEEVEKRFGLEFVWHGPPDWLKSMILDAIFQSTDWLENCTCPFHDNLISHYLSINDSIISFNYDLIVDHSLKSSGLWSEKTGYGFEAQRLYTDAGYYQSKIELLKPHGSINWIAREGAKQFRMPEQPQIEDFIEVSEIVAPFHSYGGEGRTLLSMAPSTFSLWSGICPRVPTSDATSDEHRRFIESQWGTAGFPLPLIVAPTKNKPISKMTFGELRSVWRKSRVAIERAEEILAIGFSFRDSHFNYLILDAAEARAHPVRLVYVNKNEAQIEYVRGILSHPNVRIEIFNGHLVDYVTMLR